ncbi:MAG: hypothetical protein ACI9P5_004334 [Saprospiraceae bacterium]|jgi:hypothetical protein
MNIIFFLLEAKELTMVPVLKFCFHTKKGRQKQIMTTLRLSKNQKLTILF